MAQMLTLETCAKSFRIDTLSSLQLVGHVPKYIQRAACYSQWGYSAGYSAPMVPTILRIKMFYGKSFAVTGKPQNNMICIIWYTLMYIHTTRSV